MSLKEALAFLDNRIYIKPKVPFFIRLVHLEQMLRSERSLYALKTAVAVSVLAVFLLAPSLQGFFVEYALTGGLITLVVALAPSLGQTIFTFVMQIGGVAIGSIYGMVVLFIFRDVGGFTYNPVRQLLSPLSSSLTLSTVWYGRAHRTLRHSFLLDSLRQTDVVCFLSSRDECCRDYRGHSMGWSFLCPPLLPYPPGSLPSTSSIIPLT